MPRNERLSAALTQQDLTWIHMLGDLGAGLLLYDNAGQLIHRNELAVRFLGQDTGALNAAQSTGLFMKYMYDSAVPADDIPDILHKYMASRGSYEGDFHELIRLPGTSFATAKVKALDDGRTTIILYDLTPLFMQQQQRDDLSWQHYALLQAVEHGQTGVMLYDPRLIDQPVIFVNSAFCQLMGLGRDAVTGMNWRLVMPEMAGMHTYRVLNKIRDGKPLALGCQQSELEDLGIIFVADISSLNEKEEQVRQMQKLEQLGQLAGGVAHDFNNILGILRGYTHILKRHLGEDERFTNALGSMLKACERGTSLTDKLLAFSRRRVNDPQSVKFNRVMKMLEGMLRVLIPPSIEFAVSLPEENYALACSEDHLMQIIMNLVVNARDASKEHGQITVDCQYVSGWQARDRWKLADSQQNYMCIQVMDKGSGMPPEVMKRIFEPFFSTKGVGKGSGLGLAVVYGLIQQYDGDIQVESSPGQGTTFTIYMPAIEHIESEEVDLRQSGQETDLKRKVIMVVDDEPDLRHGLRLYFEDLGLTVMEAEGGDDALTLQDDFDGTIDLLLTDVRMPGIDGARLAELWREVRPESRILLMSGYPKTESSPDIDVFLAKPIDYDGMTKLIRQIIGRAENDPGLPPTMRSWSEKERKA